MVMGMVMVIGRGRGGLLAGDSTLDERREERRKKINLEQCVGMGMGRDAGREDAAERDDAVREGCVCVALQRTTLRSHWDRTRLDWISRRSRRAGRRALGRVHPEGNGF